MFLHKHPYKPYIPKKATKLIVGTLPPPRFSVREFKPGDVDFCYGSRDGYLWPVLNEIFQLNLLFETTPKAISQRKEFLTRHRIGICDIVDSAEREAIDASDLGMQNVVCRDILSQLVENPTIGTLLFMGGNSKNGPEYFFRKQWKQKNIMLTPVSLEVPRRFSFKLNGRIIETISLTSPSGAANRAVGAIPAYKALKKKHPNFNTIDFRVLQYSKYFK
ncbi:uracil-DNA glycosylase family protein [Galbibacter sp. BG1]|uniref:uracil-DNA glycosylase family protein n=1 Tax=Galbibacter sp. BG1 TaxID=1170699 RepID=UPI0015BD10CF|nr:uracil-DNA glycosylase family protein [Galbibacter sp. BG1]QLE01659.1 uracil-DNA glycosylase family protein [Galbibacter sp. BG1]